MKIDRFITPTWLGHVDISNEISTKIRDWIDFEKQIDPTGAKESTTQNGWQYIFGQHDKNPEWLEALKPQIDSIRSEIQCTRVKTLWVVDYENGGYQDPHFHNIGISDFVSIIINLEGTGDLILQDPRPLAVAQGKRFPNIITLEKGDWCAFPAYIVHNSRPCIGKRSILVIDCFYTND